MEENVKPQTTRKTHRDGSGCPFALSGDTSGSSLKSNIEISWVGGYMQAPIISSCLVQSSEAVSASTLLYP